MEPSPSSIVLIAILFGTTQWSVRVSAQSLFGIYEASDEIGLNTAELARLRGYQAEEFYMTTRDGYILNLVRITNPLINGGEHGHFNKSVVFFVHGIFTNANCFLVNSEGAKPADYGSYNASALGQDGLGKLLANDTTINSLPLLLVNWGHECWMLNRRGSMYSLGRTNGRNATVGQAPGGIGMQNTLRNSVTKTGANDTERIFENIFDGFAELIQYSSETINGDYWNYSFDAQARFDFPDAIRFVLNHTCKYKCRDKIAVLGHSAGGAIPMLTLTIEPEFASKIGQTVLWSPGLNQGQIPVEAFKLLLLESFFDNYIGPVPPLFSVPIISSLAASVCSTELARRTICQLVSDALFGPDGAHQRLLPGYLIEIINESSGYELSQVGENLMFGGHTHFKQYGTNQENRNAYGSDVAPAYNFSRITLETIHLIGAITDELVSHEDVAAFRSALSVPTTFDVVSGDDGLFNHIGYLVNDNAGTVVNLLSLIYFESSAD